MTGFASCLFFCICPKGLKFLSHFLSLFSLFSTSAKTTGLACTWSSESTVHVSKCSSFLCVGDGGRYVSNCIVYLGVGEKRELDTLLGKDAVLQVVRGLEHRGHVIVTNNYFTGIKLHMALLQRDFLATGTCKKTAAGFPLSLSGFPKTHQPPRGTLVVKMHRSQKIAAVCWTDSKLV